MKNDTVTNLKRVNFPFVDSIRCLSMMGIVFEHSAVMWSVKYTRLTDIAAQIASMQLFKFVTITFFLIGGFLINHKFTEYTPGQYLGRRFKNTIRPWLFWIAVLMVANLAHRYVMHLKSGEPFIPGEPVAYFIEQFRYILFESSFWFILNFLICISILLVFKRYIYNIWFGVFWGLVSLVYSVNLYTEWFVTHHSAALFGFVVYLWLGVYLNRYYESIIGLVRSVRWPAVILLNLALFIMASLEVYYLQQHGSRDEYNTLRVTNILYSLGMFLLLLKIGSIKTIDKYLEPRKTTFGIYLIHQILIIRLAPEIFKPRQWPVEAFGVYQNIGYSVLRFLVIYFLAFFITKLLLRTRMRWTVGG